MDITKYTDYYEEMNEEFQPMITNIHCLQYQSSDVDHPCVICGYKSIGMNFGVITCAPCKAFFRRNAQRKELLKSSCRHYSVITWMSNDIQLNETSMRYLQIRRCSSCRLRRCFDVGMKEESIRTNAENEQYRQLVIMNRRRRQLQRQYIQQFSIPQYIFNDIQLSDEIDWSHLSNIVYLYDTYCLKTYIHQRTTLVFKRTPSILEEQSKEKHSTNLTMSIVLAFSSFIQSLPAYYSLPRSTRNYLFKTNIRPLMFPNIHELNQSCFSEPWQVAVEKATWEFLCGPELYEQFSQTEILAKKSLITDPVVTRLWVIVLFFSTPLHYHHDCPESTPILKKKLPLYQVQNGYTTLLWKYLLHRHGYMESIRIYTNLIHVYLKMQRVGFDVYIRLQTQQDLMSTGETLNKLVAFDINDDQ